jgi:hypothetical protein
LEVNSLERKTREVGRAPWEAAALAISSFRAGERRKNQLLARQAVWLKGRVADGGVVVVVEEEGEGEAGALVGGGARGEAVEEGDSPAPLEELPPALGGEAGGALLPLPQALAACILAPTCARRNSGR